ncbi:hypothetical protein [Acidianus ambivalens]|nr:hypothetical protein [Acidianus ambivalens]
MVVNPSIVEKVNKEIKKIKIAEHFSRPAFMRFGNIKPIFKICKNENT